MPNPLVEDELTRTVRRRSYDVRVASQQYASIAGLLAGFAFTVLILIAQVNDPAITTAETVRRDMSGVGFLVALFGCILASFAFALITGEEALTRRANHMALFAGSSLSITIAVIFWSIAVVLRSFFVTNAANVAYQILPIFILIHPVYVIASILDNIAIFDLRSPRLSEWIIAIAPSLIPLIVALALKVNGIYFDVVNFPQEFQIITWIFVGFMIVDNIISAILSTTEDKLRIKTWPLSIWVGLHALLLCIVVLTI